MDRKKTSYIWKFFTPEDDVKAKCNLCKQVVSYKTSTTNLKRHFERKHPLVKLTPDSTVQRSNVPGAAVTRAVTESSETETQPDLQSPSTSASSTAPVKPSISIKKNTQATLPYVPKACSYHAKTKYDNSLMELFTKDMQPFSIVEDTGFRKFVNTLNPSYQLPSRKYISNTLLPALYEQKYNSMQEEVKNVRAVTVTTDCWTSLNSDSFMATTIHYINENFEPKAVLLECSSSPESHTSSNLASELNRIITLWGLENKVLLAVSDNAANIKKAIKEELQWRHFGCYAHTLNLIVKDALKAVEPIITKVRTLVAHFKRSSSATQKLKEVQKQLGKDPLKLLQDVVTRWNSTFYMIQRILQMEDVIRTTMALLNSTNLPIISVEEWQLLTDIQKVLQPMEEVTKIICGQNYVTLSSVIILTKGLENIYNEFKNSEQSPIIKDMTDTFLNGISERLGDLENSKTLLVSTFVDPRFKNIGFSSAFVGDRAKKLVITLVSNKIAELPSTSDQTETQSLDNGNSEDKLAPTSSTSIWGLFDKKAQTATKNETPATSRAIIEVQRYLEEDLLNRHEDPLKWWQKHSYNYPHLSKVVIEKFGVVATSVPCERIFSASGQIITERRSRISSEKVKKIMFLHVNT